MRIAVASSISQISLRMRKSREIFCIGFLLLLVFIVQSEASPINARYTWMLPKTVIDVTIHAALEECVFEQMNKVDVKLKITATLVAKTMPDSKIGLKSIDPESLKSFWQDNNIELKTFSGSHILSSMGSQPASAINTIFSNVVGGVTKLVAAQLGVSATSFAGAAKGPGVVTFCGKAQEDLQTIKDLKQKIKDYQADLIKKIKEDPTGNPAETQAEPMEGKKEKKEFEVKRYAELINAAQDQINSLQSALTITIKRTIDPANPLMDEALLPSGAKRGERETGIGADGLIARIALYQSLDEIMDARWFRYEYKSGSPSEQYDIKDSALFKDEFGKKGVVTKREFINRHFSDPVLQDLMTVSIYFEFKDSHPKIFICAKCRKKETFVAQDMQFREVAYIPVSVYHGKSKTVGSQLNPPQALAFAQFGAARALPLTAAPFESLKWSITFAENGEVTAADFSSKSIGAQMTQFFSTAAGARYAIATEERNAANNASSDTLRLNVENSALKAQIDNINYRNQLNALRAQGYTPQ